MTDNPSGAIAVANAPKKTKTRQPQVGLPVQYCQRDGEVIPGVLQRKGRLDDLWDVRVFPNGASHPVLRSAVRFSETPKAGYWNYIPE